MGNEVKKLINQSRIDFMAEVENPYKETVTKYFSDYKKKCPESNIFKELSKMVDDDDSKLSEFIVSSGLDWPIEEHDFVKSGGFLD